MNEGPDPQLSTLLARLRRGDEDAAQELVDRYGAVVRREIRFRLRDSRLYRVVGESDLFQSAMMRFFWGLQLGKFEVTSPQELVRLLKKIGERRVCDVARFWQAQRRDVRREAELGAVDEESLAAGATPSRIVSQKELVAAVLARLPQEMQHVLRWRQDGLSWEQIAERLPGSMTAEAARKQYERSLARVGAELGLEDST